VHCIVLPPIVGLAWLTHVVLTGLGTGGGPTYFFIVAETVIIRSISVLPLITILILLLDIFADVVTDVVRRRWS
jgi:hypothetical protein